MTNQNEKQKQRYLHIYIYMHIYVICVYDIMHLLRYLNTAVVQQQKLQLLLFKHMHIHTHLIIHSKHLQNIPYTYTYITGSDVTGN